MNNLIEASCIEEIINVIEQDIYESTKGVEYFNISLHTNGFAQTVTFCDIELWSSEDDCRLEISDLVVVPGEEDRREGLDYCLRRRLREELAKLATIKV